MSQSTAANLNIERAKPPLTNQCTLSILGSRLRKVERALILRLWSSSTMLRHFVINWDRDLQSSGITRSHAWPMWGCLPISKHTNQRNPWGTRDNLIPPEHAIGGSWNPTSIPSRRARRQNRRRPSLEIRWATLGGRNCRTWESTRG